MPAQKSAQIWINRLFCAGFCANKMAGFGLKL
jgi:hypothetical protein